VAVSGRFFSVFFRSQAPIFGAKPLHFSLERKAGSEARERETPAVSQDSCVRIALPRPFGYSARIETRE